MATLPHEREKSFLDDIVDDCLEGRNKLVAIVCSSISEIDWFQNEIRHIAGNLDPLKSSQIRIYRGGLEFTNGAKVVFGSMERPEFFRGLNPDRIVVMGRLSEWWYLALSSGAKIEAVA